MSQIDHDVKKLRVVCHAAFHLFKEFQYAAERLIPARRGKRVHKTGALSPFFWNTDHSQCVSDAHAVPRASEGARFLRFYAKEPCAKITQRMPDGFGWQFTLFRTRQYTQKSVDDRFRVMPNLRGNIQPQPSANGSQTP